MRTGGALQGPPGLEPVVFESFAHGMRALGKFMVPEPKQILYPCSQNDVTPGAAFPDAVVTYVDVNREAIEQLLRHGHRALRARVPTGKQETGRPVIDCPLYDARDACDLLVLMNPDISHRGIASALRPGGHLLCNNYHDTADGVYADREAFEPVAIVPNLEDPIPDTANLDQYFTFEMTDEVFHRKDPEGYKRALRYRYGLRLLAPKLFRVGSLFPGYERYFQGKELQMGHLDDRRGREVPLPPRVKESSHWESLFLFRKK